MTRSYLSVASERLHQRRECLGDRLQRSAVLRRDGRVQTEQPEGRQIVVEIRPHMRTWEPLAGLCLNMHLISYFAGKFAYQESAGLNPLRRGDLFVQQLLGDQLEAVECERAVCHEAGLAASDQHLGSDLGRVILFLKLAPFPPKFAEAEPTYRMVFDGVVAGNHLEHVLREWT